MNEYTEGKKIYNSKKEKKRKQSETQHITNKINIDLIMI